MEFKHTIRKVIYALTCLILTTSCSSGKIVISNNTDISKYKYVVFGDNTTGDYELDDIYMSVRNVITDNLTELSNSDYRTTLCVDSILTPNINIKSEKWDGGYTYITISFYDYKNQQRVAVVKSSGIGLSISQDQDVALKAAKKKITELFRNNKKTK